MFFGFFDAFSCYIRGLSRREEAGKQSKESRESEEGTSQEDGWLKQRVFPVTAVVAATEILLIGLRSRRGHTAS